MTCDHMSHHYNSRRAKMALCIISNNAVGQRVLITTCPAFVFMSSWFSLSDLTAIYPVLETASQILTF